MKETKEQKILWKILREMYMASTPSADFDHLIESAEKNERGQKIVPYNKHEISTEKYDEIMESNLKNQRLTQLKKHQIKNAVANFAPKFVLLLLFFTSFCGFSQTQVIEVYNYDQYGIKEISPTKIIEIKEEKTEIYNVENGIKNITPTQIIIDNKIYETDTNGLQQFFPRQGWQDSTIPPPIEYNYTPIFNLPILPLD